MSLFDAIFMALLENSEEFNSLSEKDMTWITEQVWEKATQLISSHVAYNKVTGMHNMC